MAVENTEHNKDIVRRAIAAMSRGDMAGFLADAADDVTFTPIGTVPRFSGRIQGKDVLLKGLKRALSARLEEGRIEMTIENLIAEGEYIAEQAHGKARTKTGKDYNNTYCRVWRFADGKVQSVVEYLDTELLRSGLAEG